jgi:hypothetical protein
MPFIDKETITFLTALVGLLTAIVSLIRSLRDTNQKQKLLTHDRRSISSKKNISVPRGMPNFLKKREKQLTTGAFALNTMIKPLKQFDICFTHPDNDHIIIGECKYYI